MKKLRLRKSQECCLAMNSAASLRLLVVACIALALQSCDFYRGRDFVRSGLSQSELRSLFEKHTSVALTEDEKVLNAYSDAGRDPTFWFQASFDPHRGDKLREMLLRKGYVIRPEEQDILPRVTPTKIAGWWNSAAIGKATLFTLQRDKVHSDANGVWCFVDERRGFLFACSFTY